MYIEKMKKIERLCFWQGFLIGQLVWVVPLFIFTVMATKKG